MKKVWGGLFSNLVIDNFNLPEGCGVQLMGRSEEETPPSF